MKKAIFCLLLVSLAAVLPAQETEEELLARAKAQIGSAYVYGGDSPGGFDCSGFVSYIFRPLIGDVPKTVTGLVGMGVPVSRDDLKIGDIIFYATNDDGTNTPSHVSIYVGDGKNIHAISRGINRGVNITPLNTNYWSRRYLYARRIYTFSDGSGQAEPQPQPAPDPIEDEIHEDNSDGGTQDIVTPVDQQENTGKKRYSDWKNQDDEAFNEFLRER